jgi:uncharacterized protein YlxW (UPF0749 family)
MTNDDKAKLENGNSKMEIRNAKVASWVATAVQRVSSFQFRVSSLARRVPWKLVLAGAGLFILVWAWREHDARLRRDLELQQLQQQTSAQVAALRARADTLLSAANEKNARVIRDLDSHRRQLERKGEELRQRLLGLQEEEGQRLAEVDSLPAAVVAKRVADRLGSRGEQGPGARDQGLGKRDSGSEEQASGVGGQVSGNELSDDQTRRASEVSAAPDTWHPKPGTSLVPNPALALTEEGARRIEAAFIELDACREQAAAKDGALANCQEQVDTSRAMVGELNKSVNDLNQAIRAKDEILARVEAQHRAELKAARGSRLRRFGHALEYVGAGVVIGVVLAR